MKRDEYMKRVTEVAEYHTGELETVMNLIGAVRDGYFEADAFALSLNDRQALMQCIDDHYTEIQAALTAACGLLCDYATDLDAANGIVTGPTVAKRAYLEKVYGLANVLPEA